jgi:predicted aminopeptidase
MRFCRRWRRQVIEGSSRLDAEGRANFRAAHADRNRRLWDAVRERRWRRNAELDAQLRAMQENAMDVDLLGVIR